MSKEWLASEAAKELLSMDAKKESVIEIGSNYPLFVKEVVSGGTSSLIRILEAVPKLTAKTLETGLRGVEGKAEAAEEKPKAKGAGTKAAAKKAEKKETEESDNPYVGKSAKELYDLCKERSIDVKTRQPASVYVDLLMKDDASSESEADDEWEDEAEEKSAKKAPAKKAPAKKPGRPKKKPEPEEEVAEDDDFDDDDDEWEV